jgi:hypothetical protein
MRKKLYRRERWAPFERKSSVQKMNIPWLDRLVHAFPLHRKTKWITSRIKNSEFFLKHTNQTKLSNQLHIVSKRIWQLPNTGSAPLTYTSRSLIFSGFMFVALITVSTNQNHRCVTHCLCKHFDPQRKHQETHSLSLPTKQQNAYLSLPSCLGKPYLPTNVKVTWYQRCVLCTCEKCKKACACDARSRKCKDAQSVKNVSY